MNEKFRWNAMRDFALIKYSFCVSGKWRERALDRDSIRKRQVRHRRNETRVNLYLYTGLKSYIANHAATNIIARNRNILILINDTLAR